METVDTVKRKKKKLRMIPVPLLQVGGINNCVLILKTMITTMTIAYQQLLKITNTRELTLTYISVMITGTVYFMMALLMMVLTRPTIMVY